MRILKIAAIFAGSVLGAGFASGQELTAFFVRFGKGAVFGALLSGVLIMIFGGIICHSSFSLKQHDYISYLESLFFKPLAKIVYIITQLFLLVSFAIMISGSSELLHMQMNVPKAAGECITLLICFLCFYNKVTGLANLNLLLTPVMSLGIIVAACFAALKTETAWLSFYSLRENFLTSACLYMSYNILSSAAVLASSAEIAKTKKEALSGGVLGGAVLTVVMCVCCFALLKSESFIQNASFPMLEAAKNALRIFEFLYPPLIYMAMLTTAVSSGFCVTEVLKGLGMSEKTASALLCIVAVPLSMIEFSALIKNCYALFGFLGLLLIFGIIFNKTKKKKTVVYRRKNEKYRS